MNNVIKIKRGDTLQWLCKLYNEEGELEVLDVTYDIKLQIRKGIDKDLVWDFAANNGIEKLAALTAERHNLLIKATATQTASWKPGRYFADIEIRKGTDVRTLPSVDDKPLIIDVIGDITI